MFQREVAAAHRAPSRAATPMGGLGVLVAGWRCKADIAFDIPARAFTPPPKVTSSVVHLEPRAAPLRRHPQAGARHRGGVRAAAKMLRQSLKGLGGEALLEKAGIDGTAAGGDAERGRIRAGWRIWFELWRATRQRSSFARRLVVSPELTQLLSRLPGDVLVHNRHGQRRHAFGSPHRNTTYRSRMRLGRRIPTEANLRERIARWRDAFRDDTTGIHKTLDDLVWNYAAFHRNPNCPSEEQECHSDPQSIKCCSI